MPSVLIERRVERRLVVWTGSTTSDPVEIEPGAGFNIFVPAEFAGSQLTVLAYVKRDPERRYPTRADVAIDAYRTYSASAVAVTANTVADLTGMNLFGLDNIKFVSDSSETCIGELIIAR